MSHLEKNNSATSQDIRLTATKKIWSYATGMLALSLIFAPARNSFILPLAVISGAGISTAFVWKDEKKSGKSLSSEQLQQIDERIANLETIVASDRWDSNLQKLPARDNYSS
ncbi:MAG: hypothetical protein SAL07_22965 [Oscillatoria sp. PMC 1051.18]|nr:hypothetical protein [Oscillatoria sp. PMC 1050.18]MEC5032773.1 hypothetical protein [Oscillatoria sp. PMC 1051.18]